MNQFKRCQVVMLPTKEKANLHITFKCNSYDPHNKDLNIYKPKLIYKSELKGSHPNTETKHLYIISEDEIKKGDWYIFIKNNQICKADYDDENLSTLNRLNDYCKKIIATTDNSLKIESELDAYYRNGVGGAKSLPQPSQQFIQKYIEEYNKGNIIVDVLVEYINIMPQSNGLRTDGKIIDEIALNPILNTLCIPKINPKDNTITIKKIKDLSSINFLDWYIKKEYWYAGNAYFIPTGHKKSEFICTTTSELYEIFLQDLKIKQ